ncbi:MAG: helix-hairpin-helix domain-containing protein [Caldicoprobacterales bacterium]|jgi:competence protein ComEA|nr:ComEA family DNA-binding protein [Clostridiales bacterium]
MFHFDTIQQKLLLITGVIILVLSVGLIYNYIKDQADSSLQEASTVQQGSWAQRPDETAGIESDENMPHETNQPEIIKIYITGQVQCPGVYSLTEESRLIDAIDLAGGCTPQADLTRINLAARVVDEGMYYVPAIGEEISPDPVITPSKGEAGAEKVNINVADQSQLETLTGIGPVKAQKIIEYRDKNGGFKSIEEIMNVPGIGKKTFENIRDEISIN